MDYNSTREQICLLEKERITDVLACIGEGIISTDIRGRIEFVNRAGELLTGLKAEEIYGEYFYDAFKTLGADMTEYKQITAGEWLNSDTFLKRNWIINTKKGMERCISGNCSPITNSKGEAAGMIIVLHDISETKRVENELRKAKEKAEASNKAKSEFFANMSHEIRNSINGVVGMVNLTLLTDLSSEQKENLKATKTCADSLLKVFNDILDFSKMEAGRLSIHNAEFNIRNLIEEVVKSYSVQADEKGIELNYQFSSNIPQFIFGDSGRLKQVIDNLLGNALKFTPQGSIVLTVRKKTDSAGNGEILFSVADTGIGISQSEIDLLFKSFSQIKSSASGDFEGTGLGLAICRQLVEIMGGRIWVESEKDRGSIFYFTLPYMASYNIL